jgi:hypothetical protein
MVEDIKKSQKGDMYKMATLKNVLRSNLDSTLRFSALGIFLARKIFSLIYWTR